MKRSIPFALVLFAAVTAFGQSPEEQPARGLGVVFLGFDSGDISDSGLLILADLVRREISIAPGFSLVERGNVEALLEEQEMRLSDAFDASDPVRIGRLIGARSYMVGRIGLLGTLYIISLRMIDVETGAVTRSVTEEFIGPLEDLRKPVRIAAQKILGIPGIEVNQGEFISVVTDPPGVGVYVNGLFEGNGPVVVRVPAPGKYDIKLTSDGFKPWSQNVTVEKNSTFFLKAKLLRQERIVDERTRALQDGRVAFLTFTTVYSAAASEALLYALGSENVRLYIGLPLLASPLAFFGALRATDGVVMNSGRSFMIMSSALWGSTWGLAAAVVFGADAAPGETAGFPPAYAGLSVAGSLLYGGLSTWLTAGDEPFPSSRVWLYHLGSVLGSFLGLGVPYVLGAESPGIIYAGMLTGSLAGSATALWLTRDYTEGRNVGNVASEGRRSFPGSLVDIGPTGVALGLPVPIPVIAASGNGLASGIYVPVVRARY
ncbi:MAG: hypothetical protein CVV47_13130 [Spirochaetae bacterium HGW-Spirochaetae-3]|jgi:hypothetical protein|nr:MAG: hypothetical protein CVV47_13130 [Spirochaetae bacterium HGW-Spirochaetae-3]